MKKKALALVLALAMSMALIACGQKDTPSNNANDGQSGQTDFPQKSINVIVPWNAGGGNDIAMLKRFRHSYATKNASDAAKAVASATIGSCMVHAVPKHMLATMRKQNSRTVIE